MKLFTLLLLALSFNTYAAISPDRLTTKKSVIIGNGVTGDSSYVMDQGLGSANPGLKYTLSDTSLTLNKAILRFGSGAVANQIFEADIGNGATNPKWRYNSTSARWEMSHDGTNYFQVSSEGGSASAISASNIDWAASPNGVYTKTLAANTTFTFSNLRVGTIVVRVTNTASNYTVTWPGSVLWSGGTPPVQTVGAFSDVITFVYDGTTVYGSSVQNF